MGGERERENVNEQAELTGVHQYTLVLTKELECRAIYVSRVLLFFAVNQRDLCMLIYEGI